MGTALHGYPVVSCRLNEEDELSSVCSKRGGVCTALVPDYPISEDWLRSTWPVMLYMDIVRWVRVRVLLVEFLESVAPMPLTLAPITVVIGQPPRTPPVHLWGAG
jgi:hypothetical protein